MKGMANRQKRDVKPQGEAKRHERKLKRRTLPTTSKNAIRKLGRTYKR